MQRQLDHSERWAFSIMLVVVLLLAIAWPFLADFWNGIDTILLLLPIGVLYWVARYRKIPLYAYILMFIIFTLHGLGVLGLFGLSFHGFGYDKFMHFIAALMLFLFLNAFLPAKLPRWERLMYAFFITMGFAAMNEVVEFVGSFFFGLGKGGILTLGDDVPLVLGNPLQDFDGYFDLFFNAIGAFVALLLVLVKSKLRK